MRKAAVLSAAFVAVLAVTVMAAAAWSGRVVAERLAEQTSELTKALPFITVEEQRIEHGLFSSTRAVTLKLGCVPVLARGPNSVGNKQASEPIRLQWRDVVHHAPFPSGHLGLASIESQLVTPETWRAEIERVAGKEPLLSVRTAIDLHGAFKSDLTVPSLRYEQKDVGSFSVTSVHARIQGDATSDAKAVSKYKTTMPGFELSTRAADGSAMAVRFGALSSDTEVDPQAEGDLWMRPSRSTSVLSSLTLIGNPPPGTPLKPLRASFHDSRLQLVSTLKDGLFSSSSSMTGRGRINEVAIDKVELRTSFRNIHAATYQKLVRTLLERLLRCDVNAQQADVSTVLAEAEQSLASLLVHDPEYALDSLAIELAGKRAELSYSVGTRGVTASDVALPLPAVLFSKGVLRASIKVHPALIKRALDEAGLSDLAAVAAAAPPSAARGVAAPGTDVVDAMIEQFVERGYLQRDGEQIKASASFEAGQVLLNGKAMALPDLSSLSGP